MCASRFQTVYRLCKRVRQEFTWEAIYQSRIALPVGKLKTLVDWVTIPNSQFLLNGLV